MRLCFLFSISLLSAVCSLIAAEKSSNSIDREKLANELSQKLNALGSFRAEYQAISSGKPPVNITLLFNGRQKYCLVKFGPLPDQPKDFYMVSDFSRIDKKGGGWELLMISGKEGKKGKVPFQDLFEQADNPIGLVHFMVREFLLEARTNSAPADPKTFAATVSLELGEKDLSCNIGFHEGEKGLLASWLGLNAITNAANIIESANSVQLSYPNHRTVLIDRKTGLLLQDSRSEFLWPVDRKIVLKSHSRLSSRTAYSSIIPEFAKIKFVETPCNDLYQQLGMGCLADMGRSLSTMTNFDELLQSHTNEIAFSMGLVGRQLVRTNYSFTTNTDLAIDFRDRILVPFYRQFTNDHPMESVNMTFSAYMDYMLAKAEAEPGTLASPETQAYAAALTKGIPDIISQLPDDAQRPLVKLSDVCLPAMIAGVQLEAFEQRVKQIKALDLPDHQISFNRNP